MQAITIRQPYASLIMAGIKTIETRSRPTKIRGRVLIHSAKLMDFIDSDISKYLKELPDDFYLDPNDCGGAMELPLGVILGSVDITDCIPAGDWIEKHKNGLSEAHQVYDREFALGDMSSDRFCWILEDPRPLSEPIKATGKQGFWRFELSDVDKNLFFAHSI